MLVFVDESGDPGLKLDQGSSRYFIVILVLFEDPENAKPYLNNATVIIDGSGSKDFRRELERYLKKRINQAKGNLRYIEKVKIEDSKKNNLLQVTDMIGGAVGRSYKYKKKDRKIFRNIINHRENFVQFWPK